MQERRNSIANTLEFHLSHITPWTCPPSSPVPSSLPSLDVVPYPQINSRQVGVWRGSSSGNKGQSTNIQAI